MKKALAEFMSEREVWRLSAVLGMLGCSEAADTKLKDRMEAKRIREIVGLKGKYAGAVEIKGYINSLPEDARVGLRAAVDWLEDYEAHQKNAIPGA